MSVITYTTIMSFFVKSTPAIQPRTKNIRFISVGLAAVLIVMVIAQLFKFETFPDVIAATGVPGESLVWAAMIVICEVLALPFLLAMRLSPAMRMVSMVSGWIVVAMWLKISLWVNFSSGTVENGGLLGDTIALPAGWWSIPICLSLGILAAWASWGMWPKRTNHTNHTNHTR